MFNIGIIEDDLDLRQRLKQFFTKSTSITCPLIVDSTDKFIKYYNPREDIRLILVDDMLAQSLSFYQIPKLKQLSPETMVVVYSETNDTRLIFQAFTYGAQGYLLKNTPLEEIEQHLLTTLRGEGAALSPAVAQSIIRQFSIDTTRPEFSDQLSLTNKEKAVAQLLREGHTYDTIAELMGISLNGARYYAKTIYRKLRVNSKGELLRKLSSLK